MSPFQQTLVHLIVGSVITGLFGVFVRPSTAPISIFQSILAQHNWLQPCNYVQVCLTIVLSLCCLMNSRQAASLMLRTQLQNIQVSHLA